MKKILTYAEYANLTYCIIRYKRCKKREVPCDVDHDEVVLYRDLLRFANQIQNCR
jgi:hypothetical protein